MSLNLLFIIHFSNLLNLYIWLLKLIKVENFIVSFILLLFNCGLILKNYVFFVNSKNQKILNFLYFLRHNFPYSLNFS